MSPTFPISPDTFTLSNRINRLDVIPEPQEVLTGMVQDKPASDIEERFARALDKAQIPYDFQVSFLQPMGMTGEYRLDFLVHANGQEYPIAIDGEYAHKTSAQRRKDMWKDAQFDNAKRGKFNPVTRVTHLQLLDQDMAEETVRELFW